MSLVVIAVSVATALAVLGGVGVGGASPSGSGSLAPPEPNLSDGTHGVEETTPNLTPTEASPPSGESDVGFQQPESGSTPTVTEDTPTTTPESPPSTAADDNGGVVDIDLRGFFQWALGWLADGLLALVNDLLASLLEPIIGTPAPTSDEGWFVFETPANQPWAGLYEQVYLRFVLPLSAATVFLSVAYVGLRAGSVRIARTRRLLGRIGIATVSLFLWFPLASGALQLFDAVGVVIATGGSSSTGALARGLSDALKLGGGGAVLVLVVYAVETALVLLAAVAYAVRWFALIVLTLTMPLLAAAWALDTWPLSPLAAVARRAATVFPGLLVAGLPAAFLLRIAVVAEFDFGFGGLFGVLASAALLPTAVAASAAAVLWSHRRIDRVANRSARTAETTARKTPAATRAARRGTGETVRGARNVHRGLIQQPAIGPDGEEALWSGDSMAHRVGRRGRRAAAGSRERLKRGTHRLGEYRSAHAEPDGSVSAELRRDTIRAGSYARDGLAGAVRETKRKISRW